MMLKLIVMVYLITKTCRAVIYHLEESEYERMPPLFRMDSNYDSCLRKPGGVYCVAKFELHGDPRNELLRTIREYSQHENKHYNHSLIDRAVCLTESCNKYIQNKTLNKITDLNMALEACINETIWTDYELEAKLNHVLSCDKYGDHLAVDLGDWILVGIVISLLAMNLIGSLYDVWYVKNYNKNNNVTVAGNPYLLSFSIFTSWDNLSNTNTDVRYERLTGIHGLKSITTFFVASAHVMWLIGTGYTDNPRELEMSYDYLHYQIIFSGLTIVQIFFVISGCLLAFHLKVSSKTKDLTWKDVPKIFFLRWTRLTSTNAIVILFTATWLRHLGSGPLWKISVLNVAASCRIHWWQHFLYFNNYVKEDKYCAIQTWHVAAELQLFTLGLMVYLATTSRRRYLALATLTVIGVLAPAMHVLLQDLDALVMFKPEFYRAFDNDTYRSMHILGHNNLSCHAIGMAVGFLSYYCVKHKIEYVNTKLLKFVTWCIPIGIIGLFSSGQFFYVDGDRPHVTLRMAYAAIQRPIVGIMTAILILNLILKFENVFRRFLEWRGWMITSRLCYSVYLLHVNLIHVLLGVRTQLGHVSFFHVIVNHFAVVSLTVAASIPFYLLIEAPLTKITKVFVEELSKTKQKKIK